MLSAKTKTNLSRIIPYGLIWLLFGIVYAQLERGILGNLNYYPATGNPYSFSKNAILTPFFSLVAGLLIGTLEVIYFNKLFIKKSFGQKILFKSLFYLVCICVLLLLTTAIANSLELGTGFFSEQVWKNVWAFFFVYAFIGVIVYIAAILVITQFYDEVSESIGRGVLANFFTGRYHKPVEEERIFMFVDMKSSTTIAEALGHVQYFEMLREYYSDLSDPIIKHSGEIYQYVGDEIIVSWKLKDGLLNNNCIRCFFTMKRAIKKQVKKYNQRFGVVPQFKAGVHVGIVTTGEIGVIKKDIIFTGDVLNATSRIQGLCNNYGVDILISDGLCKKLTLEPHFQIKSLGANELRGKDEKIELFTILSTNIHS